MKRAFSLVFSLAILFSTIFCSGIPGKAEEKNEVKELRTLNSKTFMNADGTMSAVVYAEPLHYLNDVGEMVEIDSTIRKSQFKGFDIQTHQMTGMCTSLKQQTKNQLH